MQSALSADPASHERSLQAMLSPGAHTFVFGASGDIFDHPGDLTAWFASPFALGCDPMQWRELQSAFEACFARGLDEDEAMLELRLPNPYAGAPIAWLTAAQRAEIELLMEECERSMSFDTFAWFVADALMRAANTARRAPS